MRDSAGAECRTVPKSLASSTHDGSRVHIRPRTRSCWLEGEVVAPGDWGDAVVIEALGRKIRDS